jgi:cystathionine beta-lyase
MALNFDYCPDRRQSDSVKWNKFDKDVLPMWVADMDFPAPPPVIKALQDRLDHNIFGYPDYGDRLAQIVADWLFRHHNWEVSSEDILFIPGVVPAFNIAARAFTKPGDGLLVQTPAYRPFLSAAANAGIESQFSSLDRDSSGRYFLSKESLADSLQKNTRMFILCNPHNPTGRVFTRKELEATAQACLANNTLICSDEIHSDIVFDGHKHIPIASLDKEVAENTITLLAPSKTFNIAGLHASVAVIQNSKLRKQFSNFTQGLYGSLNVFGAAALEAAYSSCDVWLEELLVYLSENLSILQNFVESRPEIIFSAPEGTFLAWLDCRSINLESPQHHFLKNGRVAFNAGSWFGDDGKGYIRLNFACPKPTLLEGLARIESSL